MTPRFTSSNRKLRTTAIAAMVAVSTVFSGVTPAFAADTVTNTNSPKGAADATRAAGLNIFDGSKLPKGKATDEAGLRTATDNVAKEIENFGRTADSATLAEVFAKFRTATKGHENPLLDNEEGALQALQARFDAVTAVLKTAAQNQANATASVAEAIKADDAAAAAFNKVKGDFAKLSNAERVRVNTLVYFVNKENKTALAPIAYLATDAGKFTVQDGDKKVDVVTEKGAVSPEAALVFVQQVMAHKENLLDISADRGESDFVAREYAKRVETLYKDKFVAGVLKEFAAAQDALVKAQKTDVIPMQMFLDRSRAQVLVLRLLQAKYAVAIRLIQLYENDTLTPEGQTVTTAYLNALYGKGIDQNGEIALADAFAKEFALLDAADAQAKALYDGWKADLGNSPYLNVKLTDAEKAKLADYREDQERQAYEEYRESEARNTYLRIVADRLTWQNALQTAQLKDQQAFGNAAQVAQTKANADKLAQADKDIAALKAQIDGLKAGADKAKEVPAPTPSPAPSEKPGADKDKDEFPFVPVAIAGVVIAIIAALAAHFPVLLAALPKI